MVNVLFYFVKKLPLIGSFLFLLMFGSCTKQYVGEIDDSIIDISANVSIQGTKTIISNDKISWKTGDYIGVFVQSAQSNISFANVSGNTFFGSLNKVGAKPGERELYAYYPFSNSALSSEGQTIVHMNMSEFQETPFDPSMDCMVADIGTINYNESSMPMINLSFGHHLFSILKISYVNDNNAFKDQSVFSVKIESKTRILSGPYSFDVSDGKDAVAVFDESSVNCKKHVILKKNNSQKIGLGTVTTIYAFVPPGVYDEEDLSITIYTENYTATVENRKGMTLNADTMYDLEVIDFADNAVTSNKKSIICFGDSITTGTVTEQLQSLLGIDNWFVLIAGVSADQVLPIMARQGTAPLYVKGGFIIPAHQDDNEYVQAPSGFYSTIHTDGSISDKPDQSLSVPLGYYVGNTTYCPHTNPFLIKGVECEIKYNGSYVKIRRLCDGDPIDCSSDDYVLTIPYAAWKYGIPDVTTIYMGTNGQIGGGQKLADQYDLVKSNVGQYGFIGVGYHHWLWSANYRDLMYNALGDNFLDLRSEGCAKAGKIMTSMGLSLSEDDKASISQGLWPQSWQRDQAHPNETGARVYAYLIYYKMKELGYVE